MHNRQVVIYAVKENTVGLKTKMVLQLVNKDYALQGIYATKVHSLKNHTLIPTV